MWTSCGSVYLPLVVSCECDDEYSGSLTDGEFRTVYSKVHPRKVGKVEGERMSSRYLTYVLGKLKPRIDNPGCST